MSAAISHFRPALTALALMSSVAMAQTTADSGADSPQSSDPVSFSIAQKFWYASFQTTPLVAHVVLPPGSSTPVAQASLDASSSSKLMPITAVSATWKDWSISASGSPHTSFSNPDAPDGKISRDEYDFSLAYAVLHPSETRSRLSLLADYKIGEVKPITGASATEILGVQSNVRVSAILLGLSGVSPVAEVGGKELLLYGNAALGFGHSHFSTPLIHAINTRYSIAEVGLSCPVSDVFSVQLGYRTQDFTLRHVPLVTVSTESAGTILSSTTRNAQSSTEGPILGVTASF